MISWKALGAAVLLVGVLGSIKCLFDRVEKKKRPKG